MAIFRLMISFNFKQDELFSLANCILWLTLCSDDRLAGVFGTTMVYPHSHRHKLNHCIDMEYSRSHSLSAWRITGVHQRRPRLLPGLHTDSGWNWSRTWAGDSFTLLSPEGPCLPGIRRGRSPAISKGRETQSWCSLIPVVFSHTCHFLDTLHCL